MNTDDYLSLYAEATTYWQPRHSEMDRIKRAFNDEEAVPLPEMDKIEKSSVANLLKQAATVMAGDIASVEPHVSIEPLRPGIQTSEERARASAGALRWWMKKSNYTALTHQRAFYLPCYGMAPMVVIPDPKRGYSRFEAPDPTSVMPCPPSGPADLIAPWAFRRFTRPLHWWRQNHPEAIAKLRLGRDPKPTDSYEGLKYMDDRESAVLILGKKDPFHTQDDQLQSAALVSSAPNSTSIPWVVVPYRMTLDKVMGQFDSMPGMHRMQSLLAALTYIAAKKSVFGDPYLEGDNPQLIEKGNGLTGKVGIVKGGRLTYHRPDAVAANITIPQQSALERAQKLDGGMPAQSWGEQPANVRTAAAADKLTAAADSAMASYHRALAESGAAELEIAMVQAKTYWGNKSRSFYISGKRKGRGDYTPNETFEHTEVDVTYPVAGANAQTLTVMSGQLLGIGALSTEDVMEVHPLVKDPERTRDRIVAEGIQRAAISGFEQQVAAGTIPLADAARVYEEVRSNKKSWFQAVLDIQAEAQKRQAEQVDPNSPEAMPGLAAPGMGMEAGMGGGMPPEGPIEVSPQQKDLGQLLRTLRTVRTEQQAGEAA